MTDALKNLCKQVKLNTTKYGNYSLYNFTVNCLYNDGKQQAAIVSGDHIEVYGGFIEFQVYFNYSISRIGPENLGWAYGNQRCYCSIGHVDTHQFHQGNCAGCP
jgi:hypothetical protein